MTEKAVITLDVIDGGSVPLANMTAAMGKLGDAVVKVEAEVKRYEKTAASTINKHDDHTRALRAVEKAERELAAASVALARDIGKPGVTAEAAARTLAALEARVKSTTEAYQNISTASETVNAAHARTANVVNQVAASHGSASFATRQLAIQFSDATISIANGMPIMMTLLQQGGQISDVMISSGAGFGIFKTAALSAFSAITSPLGLAIGGVVALGGATFLLASHSSMMAGEARAMGVALAGVGRSAELSTTSLQKYVMALNQAGVDRADAAGIVGGLARNPALSDRAIGRVAALTPDAAVALGVDATTAAKQLGDMAAGSYASIVKLDGALNFLTASQLTQIGTMLKHGDRIGAVGIAMGALGNQVDGLREKSLSPFAASLDNVGNAYNRMLDKLTSGKTPLVNDFVSSVLPGQGIAGVAEAAFRSLRPKIIPPAQWNIDPRNDIDREAQEKAVAELKSKLSNQTDVLSAPVSQRWRVAAKQDSETTVRDRGLTEGSAKSADAAIMSAARMAAVDAANQDALAIGRQTEAAQRLEVATDIGRVAMLKATAAAEAHEKAATQAGVSEGAYAAAILRRNSAQEDAKAAASQLGMEEQLAGLRSLTAATDTYDAHKRALLNTVKDMTRAQRAAAEATKDPALIAAADARIGRTIRLVSEIDKENTALGVQKKLQDGTRNLAYLQAELATLGQSAEVRGRILATLRVQQEIEAAGRPLLDADRDKLIQQAVAQSDLNEKLQSTRATMNEISSVATQAFDQVGNAITQAFIGGSGAAVNFGNVARGVLTSVLQAVVKLAILNPIMKATVEGIGGAIGGGASSGGSSGGGLDLSTLGTLAGWANSASGALGGPSVSLATFGLGSGAGAASAAALSAQTTAAAAGAQFGGGIGSGVVGATGAGGAAGSMFAGLSGGMIGGGLGFAGGTLIGGGIQRMMNKTGPGPMVGAGAGAVTGAIIGSVIPVIGTFIGGLIGGLVGGAGGGLFGPGPKNTFSYGGIELAPDGRIKTLRTGSQGMADVGPTTSQDSDLINRLMDATGMRVTSLGGVRRIGYDPTGSQDGMAGSIGSAFGGFRFSADDADLNRAVSGKSFAEFSELQTMATEMTHVTRTLLPNLGKVEAVITGSFPDALAAITAAYVPAIALAAKYGIATNTLTDAQTRAVKAANDNVAAIVKANSEALTSRSMRASSITPADAERSALYDFDLKADAERVGYKASFVALYGIAADFTTQSAALEKTLGEERLAIQRTYNDKTAEIEAERARKDQLNRTATGTVINLANYASRLANSSASPLSPQARYSAARDAFGGASLTNLPGAADAFLSASRTVNGSGVQYANDFNSVVDSLGRASTQTPASLTASIFVLETRTSTQVLEAALVTLTAEVVALRQIVANGAAMPARVAA